ncbi:MAG: alcohol dehydrogenase catalytic domain-containing protein [Coriobacteriia bacterium]|nr:alcohol dehydrogenase catalytic domain-containing protein [Coriobacteriia bacterium]
MRSAVLTDMGTLELVERDYPACQPDDVVVAVEVCGVCRTDRKAFAMGQRDLRLPRILGHEIVGRIVEAGRNVTGFNLGDRVQVYPGIPCTQCPDCLAENDHLCHDMQIRGFHVDGGFTEFMSIRGSSEGAFGLGALNLLPDTLDSKTASLAEPVACSINLQNRMSLGNAKTIVILGAGPLGYINAKLAKLAGVPKVIVVEPHPQRRALAAGFSDFQLDATGQTTSQIIDLTEGRGADVVIPCCPGNDAMETALQVAAKRGQIGFFSGLTDTQGLNISSLNNIHYQELTVLGSYGCSSYDNQRALGLLTDGLIDLAGLPTKELSWDGLAANLASLEPTEYIFTFFIPEP